MNMHYEMFLTIQMHLTCSEKQVATYKEKNDDTFKEFKRPQTQCIYVTLLSNIIDADPSSYEREGRRVLVQEE